MSEQDNYANLLRAYGYRLDSEYGTYWRGSDWEAWLLLFVDEVAVRFRPSGEPFVRVVGLTGLANYLAEQFPAVK